MKMDNEELKKRTKDFAHRCVKLAIALPKKNEPLLQNKKGNQFALKVP